LILCSKIHTAIWPIVEEKLEVHNVLQRRRSRTEPWP